MMLAPAFSVASRSSRKQAGSVERKWEPKGSMLCSPNLFTTIAPNSVKSIPGFLEFRAHLLVGLSMNSRNGHEATPSRARGSVGNCRLGSDGKNLLPVPRTEQAAAKAEEVFRKLRRDCLNVIKCTSRRC